MTLVINPREFLIKVRTTRHAETDSSSISCKRVSIKCKPVRSCRVCLHRIRTQLIGIWKPYRIPSIPMGCGDKQKPVCNKQLVELYRMATCFGNEDKFLLFSRTVHRLVFFFLCVCVGHLSFSIYFCIYNILPSVSLSLLSLSLSTICSIVYSE